MAKRSRLVLAWGGGGGVDDLPSSVRTNNKKVKSPKNHDSHQDLWTIRYAPKHHSELCVAPKKRKQVQEFLQQHSTCCCCILTGNPGVGKSTMVSLLVEEASRYEWTEEPSSTNALESFCQFVQQVPYHSNSPSATTTVVVLDELPHLHTTFQKERFVQVLTELFDFCQQNPRQAKIIWIQTTTSGSTASMDNYTSLLPPSLIHHYCTTININPVTKSQMFKILNPILRQNNHRLSSLTEDAVTMFQGDLRQALLSLQFQSFQKSTKNNNSSNNARDTTLSPFHAMGKLLYAKRNPTDGTLECNPPEQVLEQQSFSPVSSSYFLQGHGPHFFTNIENLDDAMHYFSDAALLMDHNHSGGVTDALHPYATSLISRAVATTNRYGDKPPKGKFRSFTAPPIWEVKRFAQYNRTQLEPYNIAGGSSSFSNFVTHVYPYLQRIAPQATWNNLQSYIATKNNTNPQQQQQLRNNNTNNNTTESWIEQQRREEQQKEQEELLRMDDIDEFSD